MAEIKFYFDEHIPAAVSAGLQRRGIDVLTAQDAATVGQTDETQLAFAASTGRVIVSFDTDFLGLHQSGVQHAGILWTPLTKHSIGTLIQALLLVHGAMSAEEMVNHLEHL